MKMRVEKHSNWAGWITASTVDGSSPSHLPISTHRMPGPVACWEVR